MALAAADHGWWVIVFGFVLWSCAAFVYGCVLCFLIGCLFVLSRQVMLRQFVIMGTCCCLWVLPTGVASDYGHLLLILESPLVSQQYWCSHLHALGALGATMGIGSFGYLMLLPTVVAASQG